MHKLQNKIIGLALISLVVVAAALSVYHPSASAAAAAPLFNNSKGAACSALGASCGSGAVTVRDVVANIIKILFFVVGVAAVIMIIIGGFRYITSNGDSAQISSAKNTIIYALIGLAVAVLAQAIVAFVFNRL